ncbi:MAG: cytochrome c biosis protein CcmG, thiol:disulfide interchange protein DsbE [Solirubrobacterales bacterium]|nr:cytochrome c biosis protein CcmG, thiol:disulfide interchange protein DsbE [Solirubrobacterales bacterium]
MSGARRRLRIGLVVVAIVAVLVGVELLSGSSDSGPGKPAPQLPTTVLVPPAVHLDSLRGKPAAINFWASWCEPCRREAPELERLNRSLHGSASIVGVDWTDGLDSARAFIREHHMTYPDLRDQDGVVGQRYGLIGLPTTFILDSHGTISDVLRGPQTAQTVRRALDAAG